MNSITFCLSTTKKINTFLPTIFVSDDCMRFSRLSNTASLCRKWLLFHLQVSYIPRFIILLHYNRKIRFFFGWWLRMEKWFTIKCGEHHEIYFMGLSKKIRGIGLNLPSIFFPFEWIKNHYCTLFWFNLIHSFRWGIEEAWAKPIRINHSYMSSCSAVHNKFSFLLTFRKPNNLDGECWPFP